MKKLLLTVVIALTATIAQSQTREKGTIELIPQISYSSSTFNGKSVNSDYNLTRALSFGMGADFFLNNRWSLRSGVLFQTMGAETSFSKIKLNYLTIPLNANWHFGSTRKWNLNFGPNIGFLTSAESNGMDNKAFYNSKQFGINYGIGYKIEVTEKIGILIDWQGMVGLSDVTKDSYSDLKNVYSSFNIGCTYIPWFNY